jgi:radical SAM protein with 4Fe4S-binding SPASM domain
LFFLPERPDWLVVNENAAVLLMNCDGTKNDREIFNAFGLAGTSLTDAEALFRQARSRGLIAPVGSKPAQSSCSRVDATESALLRTVYLKLTNACNLRCKYCYADSGESDESLSIEALRKIATDALSIASPLEFVLSGGEPLLHPSALEFAEELASSGNSVQLLTNGTLVTNDELARRIARAVSLVKISLDGSTPHEHAVTRGKGNYELVTGAIDRLIAAGANVQVAMTVTRQNTGDIGAMAERFGSRLALQPLFDAGRGKGKSRFAVSGREYYDALDAVPNVAPMGQLARTLESIRGRGVKRCALANREVSIAETGEVYPCQLLHAPEFLSGNVHQQSFRDIYYNSPVLRELRTVSIDTLGECKQCAIRLICGGACRARDYHERGDIRDVGDFCQYEALAFLNGILDCSMLDGADEQEGCSCPA